MYPVAHYVAPLRLKVETWLNWWKKSNISQQERRQKTQAARPHDGTNVHETGRAA